MERESSTEARPLFEQAGRLMFGQVREDAGVDLFLTGQLQSPSKVFVIASGGCTALSLLTRGTLQVDAVDISRAQVALVELKRAMFKHLPFNQAKAACASDAAPYLARVRPHLPQELLWITELERSWLECGLNNAGWVDRRMSLLRRCFFAVVHERSFVERFLSLDDIERQAALYQSKWCNWQWRLGLKLAFSRLFLHLAHGSAARTLVPDNFSAVMEKRIVRAFTSFENASNPYLWQAMLGCYGAGDDCLPPYLQEQSSQVLSANLDNLSLSCCDTIDYLGRQPASSYDYIGLSNILELLPGEYSARMESELVRCTRPGALICVRAIFPRRQQVFSSQSGDRDRSGGGRLILDRSLSSEAEKIDRSLFCNFYEIYRRE